MIGCRGRIGSRNASSARFAGFTLVGKVVDRQSSGAVVRVSRTLAFYCPAGALRTLGSLDWCRLARWAVDAVCVCGECVTPF